MTRLILGTLCVRVLFVRPGVLYAVDAKFSILMKISAVGGPLSSGGPTIVLEADVADGPVSFTIDSDILYSIKYLLIVMLLTHQGLLRLIVLVFELLDGQPSRGKSDGIRRLWLWKDAVPLHHNAALKF